MELIQELTAGTWIAIQFMGSLIIAFLAFIALWSLVSTLIDLVTDAFKGDKK